MAIDSAEKRQNIAGCGRVFMRSHFPQATPDAEWRIAGGIAFGGNTISAVAAVIANLVLGLVTKLVLPIAFDITDTDRREL